MDRIERRHVINDHLKQAEKVNDHLLACRAYAKATALMVEELSEDLALHESDYHTGLASLHKAIEAAERRIRVGN